MHYTDKKTHACYDSPFIAMAVELKDAKLAYFGLDSGGREPSRKNTYNILKPGFGAWSRPFREAGAPAVQADDSGISARAGDLSMNFRMRNDRELLWSVASSDKTLHGEIFELRLSIQTAPPTIWADTNLPDHSRMPPQPDKPLVFSERDWSLPMLIHFPDYGTVRIEADGCLMTCHEELTKSEEMTGLNLGHLNLGNHTNGMALNFGYSRLVFKLKSPADKAALRLTILDEIYPKQYGDLFAGDDWKGFRRCWMNNFTLERGTCTMGDNIYLSGLAHLCMHNKADMLHLMDPEDPLTDRIRTILIRTLDSSWQYAQAPDGEVNWQYHLHAKGPSPMGAFIDTTPSAIIASSVIGRWKPAHVKKWLDKMLLAGEFLMKLDTDDDGIIEVPFSGNSFTAPYPYDRPRNWWDNFAFGHKDVFFNLLSHRALRELLRYAKRHHREEAATKIAAFLDKFAANFHREFFNPETGVIAGWISADGKVHDYKFTFATALAVTEGLVSRREGRKMLKNLIAQMKKSGFGDFRFGIPGPTIPVPLGVDTFDWAFMGEWPMYENGGCCGQTAYHFLNALYKVGMDQEADAIVKNMLNTFETKPTHSGLFPGYMFSVDWRTKDGLPCGYNYLADNYLFLASPLIAKSQVKHPAIS